MQLTRRAAFGAALLLPKLALAQQAEIGSAARPIRVGVTSGVHAQVLEKVRDVLAQDGVALRIVEFADFIQPNAALASGDLDANTYQHLPFLEAQNRDRDYDFVSVGKTVLTPLSVFSRKAKSLADLPQGARVAIPNDPTNGGRALLLLAQGGLIKLAPGIDYRATVADITENPKKIRIVELEAAQIARSLDDVDAGAITGNYAVPAGLNPLKDGLITEGPDSIYTCLVVVRRANASAKWAKALASAYGTPTVKAFVANNFGGAIISGA